MTLVRRIQALQDQISVLRHRSLQAKRGDAHAIDERLDALLEQVGTLVGIVDDIESRLRRCEPDLR